MTTDVLQSSIDDVVADRAMPINLLQDFLAIASLDQATVLRVGEKLRAMTGLNDRSAIEAEIRACFGDGDDAITRSIFRALEKLSCDDIPRWMKKLESWVQGVERRKEAFTPDVLSKLRENLAALLTEYPAIELMQKADRLLRDVGNELQSVDFVCDMRPVFDKPREHVEAFVLIANMRLLYLGQDGNRGVCELALTEEELVRVKDEVDRALKKLTELRRVASAMPNQLDNTEGD